MSSPPKGSELVGDVVIPVKIVKKEMTKKMEMSKRVVCVACVDAVVVQRRHLLKKHTNIR